jgi:hypothetical protein
MERTALPAGWTNPAHGAAILAKMRHATCLQQQRLLMLLLVKNVFASSVPRL